MILIQVGSDSASILHMEWTSANKELKRKLDGLLPDGGPSGADPNPDLTTALDAVDKLKGKLVSISQNGELEYVKGRVY